jgi:uncharacterized membrane protein YdcZ (DUF606 family)
MFIPYTFAQSSPLLTYIGGPLGVMLHFHIETSILGVLPKLQLTLCFVLVFVVIGQMEIDHCTTQPKKKPI